MSPVVQLVVSNSLAAGILALLVFGLSRFWRQPAVLHGLWVVVVLKLITPPVVDLPLPAAWINQLHVEAVEPVTESPTADARTLESVPAPIGNLASEDLALVDDREAIPALRDDWELMGLDATAIPAFASTPMEAATMTEAQRAMIAEPLAPALPNAAAPNTSAILWWLLGGIWLAGSLAWVSLTLWRLVRFQRLLRCAVPSGQSLQAETQELAHRMGLRRVPGVWVVPGAISPMLWAVFGRARLLFPRSLIEEMPAEARRTLLIHELAHYRRGDHWVRLLEMLVTAVYWWNPVLWWAIREIRQVEEDCCDAWVTRELPEQRGTYARALVRTIGFLSDARTTLPPASTGISHVTTLERRIRAIMCEFSPGGRPLSWPLRGTLMAVGCVVLSLGPSSAGDQQPAPEAAVLAEKDSTAKPESPKDQAESNPAAEPEPVRFEGRSVTLPDVACIAVSADSQFLVAGHGLPAARGAVSLWDLTSQREITSFDEPRGVQRIALSPDGKLLAYGTGENVVRVRDRKSLKILREISTGDYDQSPVAFSPDGQQLAMVKSINEVQVWTVKDWKEVPLTFEGEKFQLKHLQFSPDGRQLAGSGGSFSKDNPFGRVLVWDAATGKKICQVEQSHAIVRVDYSPDGKLFATACLSPRILVCDSTTGEIKQQMFVPNTGLLGVSFSPDGTKIAAAGATAGVTVFDLNTGQQLQQFKPDDQQLRVAWYTPNGKQLVTGGLGKVVRVFNADTYERLAEFPSNAGETPAETAAILDVAHSPDGRWVAAAREDTTATLHPAGTGDVARTFRGHDDIVSAVRFSPDGKTLATGSYDRSVKLWNVATGELVRSLSGHENWVFGIAFSPDGKTLASGGYDKSVRLWNVATGESTRVLTGHTAAVRTVAFSPDGKQIVSAGSDRQIKVWNLADQTELATLAGHTAAVRSVAFSPDGKLLASGSEDGTIKLWQTADWKEQRTLTGHNGMVWSVAFSAGGQNLASGGFDKTIRLWDPLTGKNRQTLSGHADIVTAVSFAPDTRALVSGSIDKSLRFWRAMQTAARQVPRLWLLSQGDADLTPLVPGSVYDHQGSPDWSVDGRVIAYDAWRSSLEESNVDAHVFVIQADGSQPKDLGDGALPQVSPDGKKITYCRYGADRGVWLMNADGSKKELLDPNGWGPTWTPDGESVAYRATSNNLTLMNLETRNREMLFSTESASQINSISWGFRFSPDGKAIALKNTLDNGDAELVVVDFAGEEQQVRVLAKGRLQAHLSWHPTEDKILFSMVDPNSRTYRLFVASLTGKSEPLLLPGQPLFRMNTPGDWSPKGDQLVIVCRDLSPPK